MEKEGTFSLPSIGTEGTILDSSVEKEGMTFYSSVEKEGTTFWSSVEKEGTTFCSSEEKKGTIFWSWTVKREEDFFLPTVEKEGAFSFSIREEQRLLFHGEKRTFRPSIEEFEDFLHLVNGWQGRGYSISLWRRSSLFFSVEKGEEDLLLIYGGKKRTFGSSLVGRRSFGSSMVSRINFCSFMVKEEERLFFYCGCRRAFCSSMMDEDLLLLSIMEEDLLLPLRKREEPSGPL